MRFPAHVGCLSGTYTLPRNIAAVRLCLRQEFDEPCYLYFHKHHAQSENELAFVVVVADRPDLHRRFRVRAEEVFVSLGYDVNPIPGFDEFGVDGWRPEDLTAHERMELLEMVRRALPGRGCSRFTRSGVMNAMACDVFRAAVSLFPVRRSASPLLYVL